jgi:preprotein translocase subunit SecD
MCEDRIPFADLAARDGGVEVRIAEAGNQQRVSSKLVPSVQATPSGAAAVGVANSGDGLIRLTPTDSGFAGAGMISGNFTLEDANTIAMLLRAGTLPGRLGVVDQQVVEAAGSIEKE